MARSPSRRWMFVVFSATFVAIALGYIVLRRSAATNPSTRVSLQAPVATSLAVLRERPGLLFSSAAFDDSNGLVELVPLGGDGTERYRTSLRCERVHFAGDAGLCLTAERGMFTTYSAQIFGPEFQVRHTLSLKGIPSRARVSPDGRRAAVTVFVSGDSYSSDSFSTRTTLIDVVTGRAIADLEQFAVFRDGAAFRSVDFNFWGVTFARDGNRFFATLRTRETNYLIEGDVDARTARILRAGVECPSLSPDETRIVFKSRTSGSQWRLHVLDVSTLKDAALDETRSVDDQAEWLDNASVAYAIPSTETGGGGSDVWSMSLSNEQPPRLLARRAYSAVAIR